MDPLDPDLVGIFTRMQALQARLTQTLLGAAASPATSSYETLKLQAAWLAELHRLYRRSLRTRLEQVEQARAAADDADDPDLTEALALLREVRTAILEHPLAAQGLFAGLVAEGRRYATTPEGAAWHESLSRSEVLHRARPVWEVISLHMLEEDPDAVMPGAYADALLAVAGGDHVEASLAALAGLGR